MRLESILQTTQRAAVGLATAAVLAAGCGGGSDAEKGLRISDARDGFSIAYNGEQVFEGDTNDTFGIPYTFHKDDLDLEICLNPARIDGVVGRTVGTDLDAYHSSNEFGEDVVRIEAAFDVYSPTDQLLGSGTHTLDFGCYTGGCELTLVDYQLDLIESVPSNLSYLILKGDVPESFGLLEVTANSGSFFDSWTPGPAQPDYETPSLMVPAVNMLDGTHRNGFQAQLLVGEPTVVKGKYFEPLENFSAVADVIYTLAEAQPSGTTLHIEGFVN